MNTPINLNKVRKERAHAARKVAAEENVARFGRSKAEKVAEKLESAKAVRHVDGHKRET